MAQIANITAKNAAASNVVFNAIQPSSGDGVSAIWRAEALGAVASMRPRLEISAMKSQGSKPGRRVKGSLFVPFTYTDANTGLLMQHSVIPFYVEGTLPAGVPQAAFDDAVAYLGSLFDSALVKNIFATGFSAT